VVVRVSSGHNTPQSAYLLQEALQLSLVRGRLQSLGDLLDGWGTARRLELSSEREHQLNVLLAPRDRAVQILVGAGQAISRGRP